MSLNKNYDTDARIEMHQTMLSKLMTVIKCPQYFQDAPTHAAVYCPHSTRLLTVNDILIICPGPG